MNNSDFFRRLNQSAMQQQDGSDAFVDEKYVDFCKKLLLHGDIAVNSLADAFLYFAAINYLNASTKQQKSIGYAFKSRISVVIAECINNCIHGVRFYLTSDEKGSVVYCLFGETFCFSFHSPSISGDKLKRYLASCARIEFDGIRKQKCPNLILKSAISLVRSQTGQGQPPIYPSPSSQRAPIGSRPVPVKTGSFGSEYDVSCRVNVYPIKQIIADFQLDRLVTNHVTAENIAVVISSVYFYHDLIESENSVPEHVRKEMFREIITQTFSVVEAVEVEIGRRIAKRKRIRLPSEQGKNPRADQQFCIDLCQEEYGFDSTTSRMYDEYKDLRHNVHLCKNQRIINDDYYTEETTVKWFSFMEQYLSHLAK